MIALIWQDLVSMVHWLNVASGLWGKIIGVFLLLWIFVRTTKLYNYFFVRFIFKLMPILFLAKIVVHDVKKCRMENEILEPFKKNVSEYLSISASREEKQPYLKGKVVVVNPKTGVLNDLVFRLPKKMHPTTPGEVETIVWLDCSKFEEAGHYYWQHGGGEAKYYQRSCDVTIIDKSIPAKIATTIIEGHVPTLNEFNHGDSGGLAPTEKVIDYLRNLPYIPSSNKVD